MGINPAFQASVALDPCNHGPLLSYQIQCHLGYHLRTAYDGIELCPVPESCKVLVEQLGRVLTARDEADQSDFRAGVLKAHSSLHAFALSLTKNSDRADDLVQDTVLRALDKRDRFQPGTNLHAWLFTILRNSFYSEYRRRVREVPDSEGRYTSQVATAPDQMGKLDIQDLQTALAKLAPDQREALLLIGVGDLSYEEAAAACGTPVGTIKSRVNRARIRLAELLGYTAGDPGQERVTRTAIGNP